jgi:hypothetical protein
MGPVAAYGARLAWSHYDQATGRYWLMTSIGGTSSRVAVGSRGSPFDVGLGPDDRGQAIAVFSRCSRERVSRYALPFSDDSGCVLRAYDFTTGRQWTIAAARSRRRSPQQPAVWGNRVAFAQDDIPGNPARTGVYVAPLRGPGRATRVHGGSTHYRDGTGTFVRGRWIPDHPGRFAAGGYGPTGIALHRGRISFTWSMEAQPPGNPGATQLWIGNVGGTIRDIDSHPTTDNTALTAYNPSFADGHLYYNFLDLSDSPVGGILTDYNLATRHARASVDGFSDDNQEAPAFLWIAASSFGLLVDQTQGGTAGPGSCASYGQAGPMTPLTGLCQIVVKPPTTLKWHPTKLRPLVGDPYVY